MTENAVAKQIVDVAYRVHSALGPGLFESVYEAVVAMDLEKRGLQVARQQPMPVVYDGDSVDFNVVLIKRGITRIANGLEE